MLTGVRTIIGKPDFRQQVGGARELPSNKKRYDLSSFNHRQNHYSTDFVE